MTDATTRPDPRSLREVYTVSRLNLEVRALLDASFPPIWVEGEISNLARPRSGHIYFSLKDENCQVRCAMFRMHNRALDFEPANGQQVLAQARVGLYPERGEFQLVVQHMEEAGAGALRRAFDALKLRLDKEGLFDPDHKQPLPAMPLRIGVVTSPTGAAVRDVLNVLRRRFPLAGVMVYPVPVQGQGAAGRIAQALDRADARAECDVLILARGGGSLEDLWAFNEEAVARAVHRCTIPVVTGIGHEIDFTIADFVADQRAPTPSAAAELITPDAAEWRQWLRDTRTRLERRIGQDLARARERVTHLSRRLTHPRRRLFDAAQKLDGLSLRLARVAQQALAVRRARLAAARARLAGRDPASVVRGRATEVQGLERRLALALHAALAARRSRLAALERTLEATGPSQTLARGYAIVLRERDGAVVRDANELASGERIEARLARGKVKARVD